MLTCETDRLVIAEATEADVDGLLAVALSNPDFTGHNEGSDGEAGRFDRGMLERDLALAWLDPARHPLVIRDKNNPPRVVGWGDVLDDHPRDHVPWIGLLEIHQQEQRRGYGREAVTALREWARVRGATALRRGVDEGNAKAFAFWQTLGFRPVDERDRPGPGGPLRVTVMECLLGAEAGELP